MSYRYPVIAYGDPDDLSASPWTDGGVVVVGGLTDPFGGGNAFSLQDNSAGALEYRRKPVTFVTTGTQLIHACVRQSPTDATVQGLIQIVDETAAIERGGIVLTFSGTTLTVSAYQGATVLPAIPLGDSWYFVSAWVPAIVKTNTNALRIYPASTAAANQSTMRVFLRNMVLLDLLDNAVSDDRPREGSVQVQSPSGVEDAWTVATDERLRATVRWVPQAAQTTPAVVSGWYGANETAGINASVKAMLRSGRDKQVLRFVPDRTNFGDYMDSYLVEPMTEPPALDAGGLQRTFALELRGSTVYTGF